MPASILVADSLGDNLDIYIEDSNSIIAKHLIYSSF